MSFGRTVRNLENVFRGDGGRRKRYTHLVEGNTRKYLNMYTLYIYFIYTGMYWRVNRAKKNKFVNIWQANYRYNFPGWLRKICNLFNKESINILHTIHIVPCCRSPDPAYYNTKTQYQKL